MSPLKGVRKGNTFAQQVADYTGTERRVLAGTNDKGDLISRLWIHECKAAGKNQPLNLSAAMSEAKLEARNAGVNRYSVIARRRGHGVAEAFFVIPLWMAAELGLDPMWEVS